MDTISTQTKTGTYFNRAMFDAMPPSAIINEYGVILDVNAAWVAFGLENGGTGDTTGLNYLAVCETATGACSEEAISVYEGLKIFD